MELFETGCSLDHKTSKISFQYESLEMKNLHDNTKEEFSNNTKENFPPWATLSQWFSIYYWKIFDFEIKSRATDASIHLLKSCLTTELHWFRKQSINGTRAKLKSPPFHQNLGSYRPLQVSVIPCEILSCVEKMIERYFWNYASKWAIQIAFHFTVFFRHISYRMIRAAHVQVNFDEFEGFSNFHI